MTDHFRRTIPVICFALLLVLVKSAPVEDFEIVQNKCLAKNNITKEEYEAKLNETSSEEDKENVEMKYKCFTHCLAKEMNILDSNDQVDVELVDEYEELSAENRAAFYKCKQQHDGEKDKCEYAFQMLLCLTENIDLNDSSGSGES